MNDIRRAELISEGSVVQMALKPKQPGDVSIPPEKVKKTMTPVAPRRECDHATTICSDPECYESWSTDWDIDTTSVAGATLWHQYDAAKKNQAALDDLSVGLGADFEVTKVIENTNDRASYYKVFDEHGDTFGAVRVYTQLKGTTYYVSFWGKSGWREVGNFNADTPEKAVQQAAAVIF